MSLKIEDYALIGDCETAALVGRDGSIDWLCWPRFDSGACFAQLLGGPDNGRWLIAPGDPSARISRHYRDGTLILETLIETDEGAAIVIDCMPLKIRGSHVVRIVRGLRGTVKFKTEWIVRFEYGSIVPLIRRHEDGGLHAVAGPDRVILRTPVMLEPQGADPRATYGAEFDVVAGESVDFTLSHVLSYADVLRPIDPEKALEQTDRTWTAWTGLGNWGKGTRGQEVWTPTIQRSLVTLRGLIFQRSGAIIAAPTTSLPEQLGGTRNWDYRFCWLRDATFTLLALMNTGYTNEAVKWRSWLVRALGGEPSQVRILYSVGGERHQPESILPWLAGYEGAQPVRIGNGAAGQLQLDLYGEVLDALYQSRRHGLVQDDVDWPLQCALLTHLETIWREPDDGIWEVRGGRQHFTYSKVMCWVAFDRGVKSIEQFGLPGPLDHWRDLRAMIHAEICEKAYDAEIGAFTQSYGSKLLDASTLLLGLVGFLAVDDPRLRGTVTAIERDLLRDGLVCRYNTNETLDGLPPGEGVFLACSFWLVDNFILLGRIDEAKALFERLLSLANDLSLLSEEYDTTTHRLVGNFPQAFSHIALVNSACNLAHVAKPLEQRTGCSMQSRML
ncbi:glycoside hydrolase family 15 protein [Beijerinckia indica]|uniref:Trehalase n=1 Tax=Beijerinckia indica subsp. indica (strain ATCC 9039 / DSM 1715 / NCIMB 8712) TaxID=395963 RepID=B2IEK0_BEII9|nr:glycoside hydrolase family 15 protein [Beijerinckia indica]ACB96942.1 glycoside hydrolase 15-related [Beijerinckia indica subsp. indica ATCC 9039]